MSRATYRYRLYPNRQQVERLEWTLGICRELYNAALEERRGAWQSHRKSIGYYEQQNQLPEIKQTRTDLVGVHAHVLQNVLGRLDKAFQAFFRRVRAGQKPGFPRFRSAHRYDSFAYPDPGATLKNGRLYLSKIGHLQNQVAPPARGHGENDHDQTGGW